MSAESLSPKLTGDSQRDDLMVQVAKLYFDLEKTQSEISKETGLTRWQVSRLLREARDCGVVRIDIVAHSARVPALEVALQRRFCLREALVLDVEDDDALNVVTQAAARYLCNLQPQPALIGVSWGRTLTKMAQWLVPVCFFRTGPYRDRNPRRQPTSCRGRTSARCATRLSTGWNTKRGISGRTRARSPTPASTRVAANDSRALMNSPVTRGYIAIQTPGDQTRDSSTTMP